MEIGGRTRELATWKSLAIEVPAAWESRRGSPIDQFNLEYMSEWVDDHEDCKFVVFPHLIFHGETCFHCMRIFRLVSCGFLTGSWSVMPMDAGSLAAFISVDRAIRIFSSRCAQCASAKHPRDSQTPECFVYGYMSGSVEHLERSAMATLASNCDWSGVTKSQVYLELQLLGLIKLLGTISLLTSRGSKILL